MTGSHEQMSPAGALDDEAIAWFTRLRGDAAADLAPEFSRWLARSPRHREAYERIAVVFEDAASLKHSARFGTKAQAVAIHRNWRWTSFALAAAITGAALLGIAALRPHSQPGAAMPGEATTERLATRHGEIRTYRLADGSSITLDTASRAEVVIGPGQRRLRLSAGRARIAIARGERPFVVEAGAGAITSSDGVLDVAFTDDHQQISLRLVAGSGEVAPLLQNAAFVVPVRPLFPGQPFAYRSGAFRELAVASGTTTIDDADWPAGWAEYRAVPLAELVGQTNRYAFEPVIIDDRDMAKLSVSGRFRLTDSEALARRLAQVFDLAVVQQADGLHLVRPENSFVAH